MKMIKKILLIIILIVMLLAIWIPFQNNRIAFKVEKELKDKELPNNTKIIDSISIAGKLSGNGNGMQYFGAILIETELSENEINEYYKKYRNNQWSFLVSKQKSSNINVIDIGKYEFKKYNNGNKEKSYIVYSWGSSENFLLNFDLRGH